MVFPILGSGLLAPGYNIENSLRLDGASRAHLKRDRSSDGTSSDSTACTFSTWIKPPSNTRDVDNQDAIFSVDSTGGAAYGSIYLTDSALPNNNRLHVNSGSAIARTNLCIRDPAAWTHIVVALDTDESGTDKCKVYVNGEQITSFATDNRDSGWSNVFTSTSSDYNLATVGNLNYAGSDVSYGLNGYLSETYFIDGQQLAASSFGETDSSGIWKPKDYTGSYGTLGFRLEYKENGTSANSSGLGADTSGNDFHWTLDNLAAADQCTDTPTNNFATLNPINLTEANASFAEGNLKFTNTLNSSPHHGLAHGTMAVAKGKWYWEVRVDAIGGTAMGIGADEVSAFGKNNVAGNQGICLFNHGYTHQRGSDVAVSGGTTYTTDDIIGVALDMDNRKIYFHKDGAYFNSGDPTSGATGTGAISFNALDVTMTPAVSNYNSGICNVNFGNPAWAVSSSQADDDGYGNFEYDVPTGYYALCTKNLAEYG